MSLTCAIKTLRDQVPPVPLAGNPREPLEAAPIKEVPPLSSVPPEKLKSCCDDPKGHQRAPEEAERPNGEIPGSEVFGEPGNPFDSVQADPMAFWEFVRTRIQADSSKLAGHV